MEGGDSDKPFKLEDITEHEGRAGEMVLFWQDTWHCGARYRLEKEGEAEGEAEGEGESEAEVEGEDDEKKKGVKRKKSGGDEEKKGEKGPKKSKTAETSGAPFPVVCQSCGAEEDARCSSSSGTKYFLCERGCVDPQTRPSWQVP